ncbi:GIY-YIG nuclease family protein [Kitasatospora sp. NPDC001574]
MDEYIKRTGTKVGCLYALSFKGPDGASSEIVKVGRSTNPVRRFNDIEKALRPFGIRIDTAYLSIEAPSVGLNALENRLISHMVDAYGSPSNKEYFCGGSEAFGHAVAVIDAISDEICGVSRGEQ